MNKSKTFKLICLLLSLLLLVSACSGGSVTEDEPEETEAPHVVPAFELSDTAVFKEESVYVNLRADGSVYSVNVTDRLHTDMPQVRVEDVSDLSGISDVKTFVEPVLENGHMFWDMEGTDLYYSGKSDAEPPIGISIEYSLDGEKISADELAGKSGTVSITVRVENRLEKTVSINGVPQTIACPMLFVGGMILPEDSFSDVCTENAVIMGDGAHKLAVFVGIPGMNESLKLDSLGIPLFGDALMKSEYTVTADAESFALGNMMFAAVPFSSVSALAGDNSIEGIETVQTLLTDVEGILNTISALDLTEMVQVLYGDTAKLESLLNAVSEATALYNENRELLDVLDKYITEENLALMEKLMTDLEGVDRETLAAITDSEAFGELLALIGELDEGVGSLSNLAQDALMLMPVLEALRNDLSGEELQAAIDRLPETLTRLKSLLAVLRECRDTIDSIQSFFSGGNMEVFSSLAETAQRYANLSSLSQAQQEHLAERVKEWLAFGQEYDIFTCRTDTASSSVIFIYKTDSIG